jgi:uracil-DNA glycosylase
MSALAEEELLRLLKEVRACVRCQAHLPLPPKPVLRANAQARLLIVGQAPGTRVQATGIPWNDSSGDRLRQWLDVDRETFYDESRIAIMPMGFCYPGRDPRGGDNPPRPECAPLWHPRLISLLTDIDLTLLVGRYAHAYYLGKHAKATMTETVASWREYLPRFLPLPHPSWRTTGWQRRNSWFDKHLLPELRRRIRRVIGRN